MFTVWPTAMEGVRWKNVGQEWEIICVAQEKKSQTVTQRLRCYFPMYAGGIPDAWKSLEAIHCEASYLREVILI